MPTLPLLAMMELVISAKDETPTEIPAPMLFAMRLSLIKPYALSNKTTACAYPFTMRLFAMHTLPESA